MNLNTGPGQDIDNDIPANVAQRGPSSGARVPQVEIEHASLSDSLLNLSTYTSGQNAFPGITRDLRPGGESGPPTQQPLYGYYAGIYSDAEIIKEPGGETIYLQGGTGGTYAAAILLSPGMLEGEDDDGNQLVCAARLIDWCQLVDGVLTPGYRYLLCSQFFTTDPS